jgi:membrane protein
MTPTTPFLLPVNSSSMKHLLTSSETVPAQGFLAIVRRVIRIVGRVLRRAQEHHIYLAASGIAFNILLFILPTMLVMVFVIGALLDKAVVLGAIEDFLLDVLPADGGLDGAIDLIQEELNTVLANYSDAGWIGIPVLFWVSLTLFSSVRTALNAVFGFNQLRSFVGSVLRDSMLLMIFIMAILGTTYTPSLIAVVSAWGTRTFSGMGVQIFTATTPYLVRALLSYLFFIALYTFAPNKRPPIMVVLISALLCWVGWDCARFAFGWYVKNLANYSKMYGIYGAVVAVAFWMYYSSLVLLFAGEIAQYWHEARRRKQLEHVQGKQFARAATQRL